MLKMEIFVIKITFLLVILGKCAARYTSGMKMCGTRLVSNTVPERIIGGRDALPGELPFQAALYNGRTYFGTGTLLTDIHVLTCGHCLHGKNSSDITIWFGVHRRSIPAYISRGRMQTGAKLIIYPAFDRPTLSNDIGIIRLRKRVILDGYINTICLPPKTMAFPPKVLVSGFGYTAQNGPASDTLRIVQLDMYDTQSCYENLKTFNINVNTTVCTLSKGKDACTGDSGGPLFQEVRGRLYQMGIVSWGRACALDGSPGVYVNIIPYLDWILGVIDLG